MTERAISEQQTTEQTTERTTERTGVRTVLVSMPWESTSRPSLALGTLAALATRAGFPCDVLHLNLDCAVATGTAVYGAFAENVELFPLAEHLFAVDVFGAERLDSDAYLVRYGATASAPGETPAEPDALHVLRDEVVPRFLDAATVAVLDRDPDVVGLTCTFNQVLPSLALARRLKVARPDVTILLGGACVHGRMGEAYRAAFGDLVDHVFTGEADDSFVAWLRAYADGEPDRPIQGVTGALSSRPPVLSHQLDALPVPDFGAYFERRASLLAAGGDLDAVRHLPYESSRGCWWGEKHHCTFCGLNNEGLTYRRKSSERVVSELEQLSATHGITSFMASDNILDFRGYRDLLDRLAQSPVELDLFYEIKANVRRADVAALRRAGVWRVQPGIESFSDHVLALMRKGTTGLANVQLLKWMQEHGIKVDFNILVGFPGETEQDYEEQIELMRSLTHLPAPNGSSIVVRVDRFSPFYDEPDALGIRGLRASEHYPYLIPADVLAPESYAYFFDRDQSDVEAHRPLITRIDELMASWKAGSVHRRARLGPGFVDVQTWTDGVMRRRALHGAEAAVFVAADAVLARDRLHRRLAGRYGADAVDAAVDALAAEGIVVTSGPRVLSVIPYAVPHTDAELHAWLQRVVPDPSEPDREPATEAVPAARPVPGRRTVIPVEALRV